MRPTTTLTLLFSIALLLAPPVASAENPLDAFGALVEGEWHTGDSRHVFEWGVGHRVVRSRSYQGSDEAWTLVGEGIWFWDPGLGAIRGIAVAIGMPVDLFEYRSEVRDGEIVHHLVAQGAAGGDYVERWTFADDEYHWALEAEQDGGLQQIMGSTYRRIATEPRRQ